MYTRPRRVCVAAALNPLGLPARSGLVAICALAVHGLAVRSPAGKIIAADNLIIDPVKQAIVTYTNRNIIEETEIRFSELGSSAGIIGAPALAMHRVANEVDLNI